MRRPAFVARSTLPTDDKRSQDGHIICPVAAGRERRHRMLVFIPSFHFIIMSWGGRARKTSHLISTNEESFQAKRQMRMGAGAEGGIFSKIGTYRVSVSGSRLGTSRGFSITDKLLIRWELVYFCGPPSASPPSVHQYLPSSATPPVCFSSKRVSFLRPDDFFHFNRVIDFSCLLFLLHLPHYLRLKRRLKPLGSSSSGDGHFSQNSDCVP